MDVFHEDTYAYMYVYLPKDRYRRRFMDIDIDTGIDVDICLFMRFDTVPVHPAALPIPESKEHVPGPNSGRLLDLPDPALAFAGRLTKRRTWYVHYMGLLLVSIGMLLNGRGDCLHLVCASFRLDCGPGPWMDSSTPWPSCAARAALRGDAASLPSASCRGQHVNATAEPHLQRTYCTHIYIYI